MPRKPSGKPSLSVTEGERVRQALERLYTEGEFKGNKTKLGKAIGRSQPAVTQLLAGTNRPSLETARAVAKLEGVPVTAYLDGTATDEDTTGAFPGRFRAARAARALDLPDSAIDQMLYESVPESMIDDPGPMYWFRRVEMLAAATPGAALSARRPARLLAPSGQKPRAARTRRA